MTKILCTAALLLFCSSGFGEPEETKFLEKSYQHQVYANILSLLGAGWGLGYEMLLQQKHGIVVEGAYIKSKNSDGLAGGLQYRFHRESGMKGGFFGVFAKFADLNKFTMAIPQEDDKKAKYEVEASVIAIGANFGKTWIWDQGVTAHYRVGYGYPIVDFAWKGDGPEDSRGVSRVMYKIISGLDMAVTLGYSF